MGAIACVACDWRTIATGTELRQMPAVSTAGVQRSLAIISTPWCEP